MNFFATGVIMVTQTNVFSTAIFTRPNECNWVQIWIEADCIANLAEEGV